MTTIKNIASLLAAISTISPSPTAVPGNTRSYGCGEVNVFYTGFPPYHPLVLAQGWDPSRVERGLRNDTYELTQAGYNVHVVWAGTEIPIGTVEQRMDDAGVAYDATAIGFGVRGATMEVIVDRFEKLVEMYERKWPKTKRIFNSSPETTLRSVTRRFPIDEDCKASNKPGRLIGYEEICDERCEVEKRRFAREKQQQVQNADQIPMATSSEL